MLTRRSLTLPAAISHSFSKQGQARAGPISMHGQITTIKWNHLCISGGILLTTSTPGSEMEQGCFVFGGQQFDLWFTRWRSKYSSICFSAKIIWQQHCLPWLVNAGFFHQTHPRGRSGLPGCPHVAAAGLAEPPAAHTDLQNGKETQRVTAERPH